VSRAVTEVSLAEKSSPEDAKAKLDAMIVAYRRDTPAPARDKLSGVLKNTALLQGIERRVGDIDGHALPSGGAFDQVQEAVAAFHAERGSIVELALAGHTDHINDSGYLQMKNTVDALRTDGISEGAIRQLISKEPVSRAEYERVKQWKSDAMENSEFTAAYLKGDPASVRMMTNAMIVLVSPIKEDAPA
jgi:hypothetical protein